MTQRMICLALAAMVTGHFAVTGYGQGGALLDRAASNTQSAAQTQAQQRAQARAQARAQEQVQQRVQAQVQQRANAQVQQRMQTRLQQRVQGQLGARVRGATRTGADTANRMRQRGNANRLNLSAGANANAEANAGGNTIAADSKIRINGSGRLVVPGPALRGNGEVNVAYFDNVFGRFNPFRQPEPATTGESESPAQPSARSPRPTTTADDSSQETAAAGEGNLESRQRFARNGETGIGIAHAAIDFSKAIRLRRSEISAIRDHALANGNVQLIASADQMEQILDRFIEAQTAAEAQARATASGVANSQEALRSGLNASANGQVRGTAGANGPRVALRPERESTQQSDQSTNPATPASETGTAE